MCDIALLKQCYAQYSKHMHVFLLFFIVQEKLSAFENKLTQKSRALGRGKWRSHLFFALGKIVLVEIDGTPKKPSTASEGSGFSHLFYHKK